MSMRVNELKYSTKEFEELLYKKNIKILKKIETLYYISSGELLDSPEFKDGKIIVQDGASYLAGKLLEAKEGERVLDSCSAPGSKTMVIAESMKNRGKIVALDIYKHKIKLIADNAKKLGIDIIEPKLCDATNLESLEGDFDRILVDAPCSGMGVIRKKPEALYNKDEKTILELADLQYKILTEASKKLKVGGTLIYSTCTIFDEENSYNTKKFLDENSNFQVEEIDEIQGVHSEKDSLGGLNISYKEKFLDGFYIIKMTKGE